MVIAVDFDGCLAQHKFPGVGAEIERAVTWCKLFQGAGARLILWTCRSEGVYLPPPLTGGARVSSLSAAVGWCYERGLTFWGVNENPSHTDDPHFTGPKVVAHLYIDDRGMGCPLIQPMGGRPYVDWERVGPAVMDLLCDAS